MFKLDHFSRMVVLKFHLKQKELIVLFIELVEFLQVDLSVEQLVCF